MLVVVQTAATVWSFFEGKSWSRVSHACPESKSRDALEWNDEIFTKERRWLEYLREGKGESVVLYLVSSLEARNNR